jgi:hypothetical protein
VAKTASLLGLGKRKKRKKKVRFFFFVVVIVAAQEKKTKNFKTSKPPFSPPPSLRRRRLAEGMHDPGGRQGERRRVAGARQGRQQARRWRDWRPARGVLFFSKVEVDDEKRLSDEGWKRKKKKKKKK